MHLKKILVLSALLVLVAVISTWLFRNYSPYAICLRHSQAEGIKSGMPAESAMSYAEGLCRSKLPLRGGIERD